MTVRRTMRSLAVTVVAGFFVAFIAASPAAAKQGQGQGNQSEQRGEDRDGDADRDPNTQYTEDNDSDGVRNNVADEGDNRHPSGKDRSVEQGRSGNQGRSESDPDDDGRGPDRSNGGPDKPNGRGGVDRHDQDGNNGCGNDDDFEDDNEGHCGGRNRPDCPRDRDCKPPCQHNCNPCRHDCEPECRRDCSPPCRHSCNPNPPCQRGCSNPPDRPEVPGRPVTVIRPVVPELTPPAVVYRQPTPAPAPVGLADTGGDILPLLLAGAGAIAAGVPLVRVSKRRK